MCSSCSKRRRHKNHYLRPLHRFATFRAPGFLCICSTSLRLFSYTGILANRDLPISRRTRVHLPLTRLSARDQFRHVLARLIFASMTTENAQTSVGVPVQYGGLKKVAPYWYPYTTMAKERWLGREILEVVSTEFRDRSMEYYVRLERSMYNI